MKLRAKQVAAEIGAMVDAWGAGVQSAAECHLRRLILCCHEAKSFRVDVAGSARIWVYSGKVIPKVTGCVTSTVSLPFGKVIPYPGKAHATHS